MGLTSVPVGTLHPQRFAGVLEPGPYARFLAAVEQGRALLDDRIVWNVNSTGRGGGVAEMLQSLLAYARGAGVDARWSVIQGSPAYFTVTKRLHNHLHGFPGDGGPLGAEEERIFAEVSSANAEELGSVVRPSDIVILHDPQTAGLCGPVKETGAIVVWRCHIGADRPNQLTSEGWRFLRPHVEPADAYVFSRADYAVEGLGTGKSSVIPPSIDAFSPKNEDLSAPAVQAILATAGLLDVSTDAAPRFTRMDGSTGHVVRRAVIEGGRPPLPAHARMVTQVSRWDRLKDPVGVIRGFADHVASHTDAYLLLAGPSTAEVADDPEGGAVLADCVRVANDLPPDLGARVRLVSLPMQDREENAAIVNALQRRADVVVQKSLAEGFGLTVAEAMWKARPVVAPRIGGIQDQVVDGETGILLEDPLDLRAFGRAVVGLLAEPDVADVMGQWGRRRVRDAFLGPRHLMQYLDLFARLLGRE